MPLAPSLLKNFPAIAPDSAFVKVVPSGNYTTGGDTLNISPGAMSDPLGKGIIGYPEAPPTVCPEVSGYVGFTATAVGAYAVVVPGATLGTYKLQQFLAGGTELTNGAAYPAGFLTGYWIVQVYF